MAAIAWRMNGLWRSMAGVLVLCALLLSTEVMCEDNHITTILPDNTTPAGSDAAATGTNAATASSAISASTVPGSQHPATAVIPDSPPDSQAQNTPDHDAVNTRSSKQENKDTKSARPASTNSPSASSGSSVFVGTLVTGLLAALAITLGYFKCQRRPEPKGVTMEKESCPVDQENQGNTLVSVAPLNPPPETLEKPSINGESAEPTKTEPPAPPAPNNGHSTAKTADTEL